MSNFWFMTVLKNIKTSDYIKLLAPLIWNVEKYKHVICYIDMKLLKWITPLMRNTQLKHSTDVKHSIDIRLSADMNTWYTSLICSFDMKHVVYVKHIWWYWKTESSLITKYYLLHRYNAHFMGCHYFKLMKNLGSLLMLCC